MATQTKEKTGVVVTTRTDCRMCNSTKLVKIWSFGKTPLANNYLEKASDDDPMAPLDVYKCEGCHLVQLRDVVDPEVLFGNYLYVSSTSPKFVAHFEDYADHLIDRFDLTDNDLVVDVGSNDGVLLKPFAEQGIQVLGIEPAKNIAQQANKEGIETVPEFLDQELASELALEKGKAKVICANNVFAHTDDVDEFVEAVKVLLSESGAFVLEVQYLSTLLKDNLFDIVYHEHVCYYHVHPLISFFEKHGMEVFDVERVDVHGGSIRVYVQHEGGPHKREQRLDAVLKEEEKDGLNSAKVYEEFWQRIEANKKKLLEILNTIKSEGKSVAGYGAPAKATTLCYAFGIDGEMLDYIVDDAEMKQGRLMPGTHIPIVKDDKPDYFLILAWNFAEPIMENNADFAGKWIVPVPEPKVV